MTCFSPSRLSEEPETAAFDHRSASVIKLNNSTVLYLKEVSKVLAMACIFRTENYAVPGTAPDHFSC